MAVQRGHWAHMLTTIALVTGLTIGMTACSTPNAPAATSSSATPSAATGHVAIFAPSDGLTISQHTPLSKWAKLVPQISKALQDRGVLAQNITTKTSSDFDEQSRDIQDYVVDTVSAQRRSTAPDTTAPDATAPSSSTSSSSASASASSSNGLSNPTTLIVAPTTTVQETTRQYGDYVSHALTWNSHAADDGSSDENSPSSSESSPAPTSGSSASSPSASSSPSSSDDSQDQQEDSAQEDAVEAQSGQRLVSALTLARNSGMHIIVLSNSIQGFTPDVFVQMSTARQIGAMQAKQMVNKLALSKATARSPKSIEILLPYSSDNAGSGNSTSETVTDPFAKEAFAGIWSVLEQYVRDGKVISPSGKLTAQTTGEDWRDFAFQADKTDQVKAMLDQRLSMTARTKTHTRVDGIIAMNDFVASGVVEELDALHYTGTSADVNPSISVLGIVNSMTGRKDLSRSTVPKPAPQSTSPQQHGSTDTTEEEVNARWPIVTGYGSYINILPQIVNGQQWMTGMENRTVLTDNIAQACVQINSGAAPSSLKFLTSMTINGVKTSTITEEPIAISADNLKHELIDPGYITLADAGL